MSDAVVEKKTTLAMLVECLMKYEGLTSTKQLAERTGRSERQIWKAKAELRGGDTDVTLPNTTPCQIGQGGDAKYDRGTLPNTTGAPCQIGQGSASRTRAQKESPIGDSYTSNVISFYDPDAKRCWIEKETDKLRLCDELYNYWSDKFGSAEFLDLALIQAKPYIQPKSGRPLETQVSAQLARNLQNKLQGDKRYSDACKANGRNQPKASADEWSKVLSEIGAQ